MTYPNTSTKVTDKHCALNEALESKKIEAIDRLLDSSEDDKDWLWCGDSAHCKCSHHLADHSRNDDPRQGHCIIKFCSCSYFAPYRRRSEEVE